MRLSVTAAFAALCMAGAAIAVGPRAGSQNHRSQALAAEPKVYPWPRHALDLAGGNADTRRVRGLTAELGMPQGSSRYTYLRMETLPDESRVAAYDRLLAYRGAAPGSYEGLVKHDHQ